MRNRSLEKRTSRSGFATRAECRPPEGHMQRRLQCHPTGGHGGCLSSRPGRGRLRRTRSGLRVEREVDRERPAGGRSGLAATPLRFGGLHYLGRRTPCLPRCQGAGVLFSKLLRFLRFRSLTHGPRCADPSANRKEHGKKPEYDHAQRNCKTARTETSSTGSRGVIGMKEQVQPKPRHSDRPEDHRDPVFVHVLPCVGRPS